MKLVWTGVVIASLALAGVTAAVAGREHAANRLVPTVRAAGKTTVCHRGRSLRVSNRAVAARVRRGDVVGACKAQTLPARFAVLRAKLTPVAGATGRGTALVGVAAFPRGTVLCYIVRVTGVASTAAHIHTAVAQTIGRTSFAASSIVVPLKTPNANGRARDCMLVSRATARALLATPGNFYVNVHSAAFPNGQVQGTLTGRVPSAKPTAGGNDHHAKVPLVSVGGSGVGGFVQLTAMPHGGTNIHVHATGLTPGTTYGSFYYESSDCTGEHDLIGTYTANAAGIGNVHEKADEDLDEIGSVSVRTPDYVTALFACATVG